MGRKTKRNLHSQDSRTYQFRPRNGLGLYYPKSCSTNTSSIFHYIQRGTSPDLSLENDQDLVEGILFTSYKELRGLEDHSPLAYIFESSADEYGHENDSINLFDEIAEQLHSPMDSVNQLKYISQSDRLIDDTSFFRSPIELSMHSRLNNNSYPIFQPIISNEKPITGLCSQNIDSCIISNISDDMNAVETYPQSNIQPLPRNSTSIVNKSHPFLIENLLRKSKIPKLSPDQSYHLNVPLEISCQDHAHAGLEYTSLSNTHSGKAPLNQISDSPYSQHISSFPKSKDIPLSIINDSNTLSFEPSTYIPMTKQMHPSFGFSPHNYSFKAGTMSSLSPIPKVNRISTNSSLGIQKKNFKISMTHAFIAWSIYARETHLKEEDLRERGLCPLSLHRKSCFNRLILRPKPFREPIYCCNNIPKPELHITSVLPPLPQPSVIFSEKSTGLSEVPSNFINDILTIPVYTNNRLLKPAYLNQLFDPLTKVSNEISTTTKLNNFNRFLQFPIAMNSLKNFEQGKAQISFEPCYLPTYIPNQHGPLDIGHSDVKSLVYSNHKGFESSILPSNLLFTTDSQDCQFHMGSNISLLSLQALNSCS